MRQRYLKATKRVMDVLRHSGNVRVEAPKALMAAVNKHLRAALAAKQDQQ